jgi:hypothetical protein
MVVVQDQILFEVDLPNFPSALQSFWRLEWPAETFKFLCKAAAIYQHQMLLQLMFLSEVEF